MQLVYPSTRPDWIGCHTVARVVVMFALLLGGFGCEEDSSDPLDCTAGTDQSCEKKVDDKKKVEDDKKKVAAASAATPAATVEEESEDEEEEAASTTSGTATETTSTSTTTTNSAPQVPATPVPLALTAVSPASGPTTGGPTLTLTGTSFASGMTVTIGSVACTSVTIASSTQATCTTGAGSAGVQNVAVTLLGDTSTLASAFTRMLPASLSVSSSTLAFGKQPVDFFMLSNTVTVTNSGAMTATSMTGATPSAPFSYLTTAAYPGYYSTAAQSCGATLAAGATCILNVSYAPTAAGAHATNLSVSYHDGSTSQSVTVALSGTGAAPGSFDETWGTVDEDTHKGSFFLNVSVYTQSIKALAYDETTLIAAYEYDNGGISSVHVLKMLDDGSDYDTRFIPTLTGCVEAVPAAVRAMADHTIVVAFSCLNGGGDWVMGSMKVKADMSGLDTTYGASGIRLTSAIAAVSGMSLQTAHIASDGSVVLVARRETGGTTYGDFFRFTAAGAADTTFDADGYKAINVDSVTDEFYSVRIAVAQADQALYYAYTASKTTPVGIAITKLSADGSINTAFGTSGTQIVTFGTYELAAGLQVVESGSTQTLVLGTLVDDLGVGVARLSGATGALDATFASSGKATMPGNPFTAGDYIELSTVYQDDNGSIVIVGSADVPGSANTRAFITRFTSAGAFDTAFGGGAGYLLLDVDEGDYYTSTNAYAMGPSGEHVLAGNYGSYGGFIRLWH